MQKNVRYRQNIRHRHTEQSVVAKHLIKNGDQCANCENCEKSWRNYTVASEIDCESLKIIKSISKLKLGNA